MIKMFTVTLSSIRNGIREIQAVVFGGDSVTLNDVSPWGIDSQPVKDAKGICSREDRFVLGYQGLAKKAKNGETILYSTDEEGNQVTAIHLTNKGEVIVKEGLKFICNIAAEFNAEVLMNNTLDVMKGVSLNSTLLVAKDVTIESNLTSKKDIIDKSGSMAQIRLIYTGHNHNTSVGPTSPPNQAMSYVHAVKKLTDVPKIWSIT